jgi:hypothetical protein
MSAKESYSGGGYVQGFSKEGRRIQDTYPIQMAHPFVKVGISGPNIADVALEVLNVDGIEADDGGEETDISFRYVWA